MTSLGIHPGGRVEYSAVENDENISDSAVVICLYESERGPLARIVTDAEPDLVQSVPIKSLYPIPV